MKSDFVDLVVRVDDLNRDRSLAFATDDSFRCINGTPFVESIIRIEEVVKRSKMLRGAGV
jgi:hypothetical protein